MRIVNRLADRLLAKVAPKSTAAAENCWWESCPWGSGLRMCCERSGCAPRCE